MDQNGMAVPNRYSLGANRKIGQSGEANLRCDKRSRKKRYSTQKEYDLFWMSSFVKTEKKYSFCMPKCTNLERVEETRFEGPRSPESSYISQVSQSWGGQNPKYQVVVELSTKLPNTITSFKINVRIPKIIFIKYIIILLTHHQLSLNREKT